jgi:hypothetical protein
MTPRRVVSASDFGIGALYGQWAEQDRQRYKTLILARPPSLATRSGEAFATCNFEILVDATLLTSGFVTIAFLLALRLLIRDFFSMDIACSFYFELLLDADTYCTAHAKVEA